MNKKINGFKVLSFIIVISFFSCEKKIDVDIYENIKKERDSLLHIVNEISNKYVFDSVRVRTVADPKNTNLPNSDYKMEFYFIGYNKDSYYIDYDTLFDGEKIIKDDTLKPRNGIIQFKKKLEKKENKIEGFINMNSKYGKSLKGILYDTVKTKSE